MASERSPVSWARWGLTSRLLAALLRPKRPSVLILSLPRSGSSWVGDTLGHASNALYLREPINQSRIAQGEVDALIPVVPDAPPPGFKALSDEAFTGLPNYSNEIVMLPCQWRLSERRRRRLVIKEVIPLASAYFCQRFQPRLIYLVRHPAAVALSFFDRGWYSPERTSWYEMGLLQGRILKEAHDFLRNYPDSRVVRYEDLCLDPMKCYEELFHFAELDWDQKIVEHIAKATSSGDSKDPYSTSRRSQEMVRAWVPKISTESAQQLREGYIKAGPPWYQAPEDWRP